MSCKSGPTWPGLDWTQVLRFIWITFCLYIVMFLSLNSSSYALSSLWLVTKFDLLDEVSFFSFSDHDFWILKSSIAVASSIWPSTLLPILFWLRFILNNQASLAGTAARIRGGPPRSCDYFTRMTETWGRLLTCT